MTQILRQSTQIKVVIGPVVAVGDGFTPVTTLSLASADEAEIIKSDSGTVTDISAATFAAITSADGYYNLTLTTSHTDTVGLMTVLINDDSLCLPVKATFQVIEEAVYDALYAASALGYVANAPVNVAQISGDSTAADNLEAILDGTGGVTLVASAFTLTTPITANATQISGDATAADNAESFFDGTGYAGTNNVIPTVTTLTGHTAQTGDAYAIVNSGTHGNAAINTKLGTPSDLGTGATIAFNLSDIHTDTAAIDAVAAKLSGLVMASEVIGSTGNSTTTVHLSTLTYGNDEINDQMLVIYDNSTGEFHARWITAWSNASKLATVATLPFTPENAVDTYYLTSLRRDMTAATVSDKTGYSLSSSGMDSVTLPANLITATSIANDAITAAKIANGAIDAATFAADVDAEILSYLVDDATRIDASALNTATVTTIPAILDDTDLIDDGTSGLAKIATDVAAILVDTAVIGALGAGLTAIIGADGDTLKSLSDQIDGLSTSAAPQLLLNTTIATLATQTSFTLTAGSADNDAYNGAIIVVTDQSTATQKAVGTISDYVGASKTITLSADPAIFTMAVGDTVDILAAIGSAPTVTQIRQEIDSNSTQLAAIVADTNELQTDWANGGRLDLLLDATLADTNELQTDWVNGGRLDLLLDATLADTNELQTDWANGGRLDLIVDAILVDTAEIGAAGAGLTAIQLPSNGLANVTAWTVAITGNITGNLSGSVGSVSGAVGSVTGNVGGNVTGSVGSVLGGINTTAGVITTLDGLDTAQDTQHSTTQGLVTTVDTVVNAVKLKTDNLPASPAAVGSAMTLTSGERDSIAAALLDLASAIDGKTPRQALRYMAAALAGRVSGAGTGTEVFKGLDESTTRITATVDSSGNRTDIAYD